MPVSPDPTLASYWDEARGDLPPAERDFRPALVFGALSWIAALVIISLMAG